MGDTREKVLEQSSKLMKFFLPMAVESIPLSLPTGAADAASQGIRPSSPTHYQAAGSRLQGGGGSRQNSSTALEPLEAGTLGSRRGSGIQLDRLKCNGCVVT
eukprot:5489671-Amphidinium_carterae.1